MGKIMTNSRTVHYGRPDSVDTEDFRRVLVESGLGGIRPVDDEARLAAMISAADIIVTARLERPDGPLVGIARGLTDFTWSCYLSELAVSACAQGLGIGRGLMDETRRALGPGVSLILASVPDAVSFYERIGMATLPDCFWFRREY